jgi:hypothetical protein
MFGVDKTLARLQVDALGAAQSGASTLVLSLAALRRQMSASMNRRVLDTIPGIRLTPIRNFRRGSCASGSSEQSYPGGGEAGSADRLESRTSRSEDLRCLCGSLPILHHDRDGLPYTIARQGDTLTAKGRDDPKCTLRLLSETRFWNADWGEFVFERDTCSTSNIKDSDNRHTEPHVRAKAPH